MTIFPHKRYFFFVNWHSGFDTSVKFGMNFAQYVAMPRKLLTRLVDIGGKALLIVSILCGSGAIPLLENTNPTKVMVDLLNSHLLC